MPRYRITIRHGRPVRYHIEDVEAADLRAAMLLAADRMPEDVVSSADLLEVRSQVEPEDRPFGPG